MRSNARQVIQRLKNKLEHVKRDAPVVIANEGQRHFNEQFYKQRWEGDKWPEVDRRKPGTFAYKYPKKKDLSRHTRPILIGKTTRLKQAVNRAIKGTPNHRRIVWGVFGSVGKYAYYHNEGIGQKKRRFMGVSRSLRMRLKNKFEQVYKKAFR